MHPISRPIMRLIPLYLLCLLAVLPSLLATDYYVDPVNGDETNPGTLALPLKSAKNAINNALPGDTIYLLPGIYREKLWIISDGTAANPIRVIGTSRTNGSPDAVITTMRPATPANGGFGSWQVHSGKIYRMSIPVGNLWSQGYGLNLLRVDGEWMLPARWPNASGLVDFDRNKMAEAEDGDLNLAAGEVAPPNLYMTKSGFYEGSYTDNDLSGFAVNSWAGAHIDLVAGQNWWLKTGVITANSGSNITFKWQLENPAFWPTWRETPGPNDRYALWGHLQALDSPGEFFQDKNNISGLSSPHLFVWLPDGSSPAGKTVELRYDTRAIELTNIASYITFENIKVEGGDIFVDADCPGVSFDQIETEFAGYNMNTLIFGNRRAIDIEGSETTVTNSLIKHNFGSGIEVSQGNNTVLENNVVYNSLRAGIDLYKTSGAVLNEDLIVRRNTVFDSGGTAISMGTYGSLITLNNCYNFGLRINDIAGINNFNGGDLQGTEVSYNWVYNGLAPYLKDGIHVWNGTQGIRLDGGGAPDGASNAVFHHNVVWNVTSPQSLAFWSLTPGQDRYGSDSLIKVFQNTGDGALIIGAADTTGASEIGHDLRRNLLLDYDGPTDEATVLENNLSQPEFPIAGNYTLEPEFISPLNRNYQLQAGSPVRDLGTPIAGITETGPEAYLGAYNPNGSFWRPGAQLREVDLALIRTERTTTVQNEDRVRIHGLPLGRSLPDDFSIRIAGRTASGIELRYLPELHSSEGLATVDLSGLSGAVTVEVSLDGVNYSTPTQATMPILQGQLGSLDHSSTLDSGGSSHSLEASGLYGFSATRNAFSLSNLASSDLNQYPIPVHFDSTDWEAQGMQPDGSNLRFYEPDGTAQLDYYIESGLGTATTLIWLRRSVDAVFNYISDEDPTGDRYFYSFISGDPAPASDFNVLTDSYSNFNDSRLILHLRANQLADSVSDGGAVSAWNDPISATAYQAVQTTATERPTFRTDRINGLGVIEFDGTGDHLTVNGATGLGTGPFRSFVVYRNPNPGSEPLQRLLSARDNTGVTDWQTGIALQATNDGTTGAVTPNNTPTIITQGLSDSRSRKNFTIGKQALGSFDRYKGEIGEIIVFSDSINSANQPELWDDIDHYLQRKWGLVSTPALAETPADSINPLQVYVDNSAASDISLNPDGSVHFTAPPYSGTALLPATVDVTVILPDGSVRILNAAFTYLENNHSTQAYEGFDYTIGSTLGNSNGGYGWSSPWGAYGAAGGGVAGSSTNPIYSGSMLTPTGYSAAISGHKMGDADGNNPVAAVRQLAEPIDLDVEGALYFSFIVSTTGSGNGGYSWLGFYDAASINVSLFKIGIWNSQYWISKGVYNTSAGPGSYSAPSDALLVGKLSTTSNGNDTLQVQLYAPGDNIDAEPTNWGATYSFDSDIALNRIYLNSNTANFEYFDEIRVGTRFADVTRSTFAQWAGSAGYLGAEATPAADPNANGISNLVEYALGISPADSGLTGLPQLGIVDVVGTDYISLTFTRRTGADDLNYAVQYSEDLIDWNPFTPAWSSDGADQSKVVSTINNGDGTETITVRHPFPMTESKQFMRLSIDN